MIKIKCKDCGTVFFGKDEYEAELKWNNHECLIDEELKGLSLQELRKLAFPHLYENKED